MSEEEFLNLKIGDIIYPVIGEEVARTEGVEYLLQYNNKPCTVVNLTQYSDDSVKVAPLGRRGEISYYQDELFHIEDGPF